MSRPTAYRLLINISAIIIVAALTDWVIVAYVWQRPSAFIGEYLSWLALVGVCRTAVAWGEWYLRTYAKPTWILLARGILITPLAWLWLTASVNTLVAWRNGTLIVPQGSSRWSSLGVAFVLSLLIYLMLYPLCLILIRPSADASGWPAASMMTVPPLRRNLTLPVRHAGVLILLVVLSAVSLPQYGPIFWTVMYTVLRLIVFLLERAIYSYGRGAFIRITRLTAFAVTVVVLVGFGVAGGGSTSGAGVGQSRPISSASFLWVFVLITFLYTLAYVVTLFISFVAARAKPAPLGPQEPTWKPVPTTTLTAAPAVEWLGDAMSLGSLGMVFFIGDPKPAVIGFCVGTGLAIALVVHDGLQNGFTYSYIPRQIYSLIGVPVGFVDFAVAFAQSTVNLKTLGLVFTGIILLTLPRLRSLLETVSPSPAPAPSF